MAYYRWYGNTYGRLNAFIHFWGIAFAQTGWMKFFRGCGTAIGMFLVQLLLRDTALL